MKEGLTGRADLIESLHCVRPELRDAVAHLLGYERINPRRSEESPDREHTGVQPPAQVAEIGSESAAQQVVEDSATTAYWQPYSYRAQEPVEEPPEPPGPIAGPPPGEDDLDSAPPGTEPLASPAGLATRLRRFSVFEGESAKLDLDRIVDRLSRGQWLNRLPRLRCRRWGPALQIIKDRGHRLVPYWLDQELVASALGRFYPDGQLQVATLGERASEPRLLVSRYRSVPYQMPDAGTPVLALGDLGTLDRDQDFVCAWWLSWGKRLLAHGNPPLALVPCHAARSPAELARVWTILPWEHAEGGAARPPSPVEAAKLVRLILILLSFTLRVEPLMIRALRRMFPEGRADAGIEAQLWQDECLVEQRFPAAKIDPRRTNELRAELRAVEPAMRQRVYSLVRQMRRKNCAELWHAEVLGLEREVGWGLVRSDDFQQALRWSRESCDRLERNAPNLDCAGAEAYHTRLILRGMSAEHSRGRAARDLHRMWSLVHSPTGGEPPPPDFRPELLAGSGAPRTIALSHAGDELIALPFDPGDSSGSPLGLIRTRNRRIKVEPFDPGEEEDLPRPAWAVEVGTDRFGTHATFEVRGVRQKLRWIPPGRFLMGSPDDEEGRWDNEGPQHEVIIERGFWMFDTPCTQALWDTVMAENRSAFRGPNRPVDNVSWDDTQSFLARLRQLVPGLELSLPSEEQWEYACRAGTSAPRYADDLSAIAWYDANSGGETHPVGQKHPNGWGLYDMLGNVYEWCADAYRPCGRGERQASVDRVLRGVSWANDGWNVRAAYRFRDAPGIRSVIIGFRCAELRSPGPGSRVERAASRSERRAESRGDDEAASEARWLDLTGRDDARLPFPAVVPVRVLSDMDQLTIRTVVRPAWASAIGRDGYGLWADLKMAEGLFQRLRWIPPGRFLMGSPAGEAGRYDDEGPQHEETIDQGFWMFDTPCTQAVWEAVMAQNPSRFRSPTRPVEQVSWNDCQEFLDRLNRRLEGLQLALPSEPQWEYACRAGTTTATYAGDLEIRGVYNAPVLNGIAWYGGNCGVEFDLSDGYDTSAWRNKQYHFERAGTRPVGQKRPNGWGLYDMLGNVWEWCAGAYQPYGGAGGPSAARALRGGSWFSNARLVRAADRYWYDPGYRPFFIGFRCAEFRGQVGVGDGRAVSASERVAEPRGDREPARPESWARR
jgi:formylglycine-generating enzyme required for sulfatase activity